MLFHPVLVCCTSSFSLTFILFLQGALTPVLDPGAEDCVAVYTLFILENCKGSLFHTNLYWKCKQNLKSQALCSVCIGWYICRESTFLIPNLSEWYLDFEESSFHVSQVFYFCFIVLFLLAACEKGNSHCQQLKAWLLSAGVPSYTRLKHSLNVNLPHSEH